MEKRSDKLYLLYSDDGRGLHLADIRRIAEARNLVSSTALLSPTEIAELIFDSGLSTADRLTEISGRGVGMGAVRNFIEQKSGTICVILHPNQTQDPSYGSFQLQIVLPFYELFEQGSAPQALAS